MRQAQSVDVTELIDGSRIGRFHVVLFGLCAMSLIMDGFDVQAMGYVAPEVLPEFGMSGGQLGNVLAAANVGLLLGALLFTILADRIGRRPVLILGTLFYGLVTLLTARADGANELLVLRFIGGIGMGSIIPNATALIGEYSPKRLRVTLIMAITVGFTAGAALGGFVAAWLMPLFGWQSVFYFGGAIPLVVGVAMILWLPESLQFLAVRKRYDELARWLERVAPGTPIPDDARFDVAEETREGVPVKYLLAGGRAVFTALYWLVNFTNLLNLYFLAGLLPTILSRSGLSSSTSAFIGGMMQLGGTIGTFGLAWLIAKKGFTSMLTLTFAIAALAIAAIGAELVLAIVPLVTLIVFIAGWCVIGGQPGLNAFAATYYPTYMRSTGIGWGLGWGRAGAIVGPIIGGQLLDASWPTQQLFLVFAAPAVVSTLVMLAMHVALRPGQAAPAVESAWPRARS